MLQNCDNVPYVLKTDDDVFINVRNLLNFVVDNRKPNLLIGTLQCGAVPIRVSLAAAGQRLSQTPWSNEHLPEWQ